ncbi:MAG: 23S rRNA (adenine(2503)-C(2))-methyltransferase RlmN [Chloroflexi bacterium]|nr:23S rRNA (adenine(2503)-C(2))-methyltransferase RlmN [Chloroflexota bacterium]
MALAELLQEWGEPAFRLRQIQDWKYRKMACGYAEMGNLPRALRERLAAAEPLLAVQAIDERQSSDGSACKALLQLADRQLVESVLMRHDYRNTVCVSSQAGCKMRCSFCATGHGGWRRNLSGQEIADQAVFFAQRLHREGSRVTNVVFMGMGEPLDNYDGVIEAIHLLNGPFGLAARGITVSTCGLAPEIERLAEEPVQVNLAVSLAATTDDARGELIPVNRRWPIATLLAACDLYARRTHRRVTYEFVLIAGVNDSPAEAERLAGLLHGRLAHVNLIPLNPVEGDAFRRPDEAAVRRFEAVLRGQRLPVSVRYSKGVDIVAGCGQLRAERAG